jgi:hypothetical protein
MLDLQIDWTKNLRDCIISLHTIKGLSKNKKLIKTTFYWIVFLIFEANEKTSSRYFFSILNLIADQLLIVDFNELIFEMKVFK